jgi:hypothetical protein
MFDLNKNKYPFLVENCYNLYAKETEAILANSDKYFAGGIIGYVQTSEYATEGNIWLKDCYSVDVDEKGGIGSNEYRHNTNVTIYGNSGVEVIANVGTATADEMSAQIKKIIIDTAYIQSGSKIANKWYTGEGEPSVSAIPGDMYFDSLTSDVYQFVNGWEKICNIKGEAGKPGDAGADGNKWLVGKELPADGMKAGDFFLNTETYDLYQYVSDEWSKIGNIKGTDGTVGAPGVPGVNGTTWFTGLELPEENMKENDIFLNLDTYDLYQYKNSEWVMLGNIKGADGEQGKTGATGASCGQNAMEIFGLVSGLCAVAFAFKKFTR